MKEIPILYSTPMVKALLAGRKTNTRRVINPQPIIDHDSGFVFDGRYKKQYSIHNWQDKFIDDFSRWMPEDLLWSRESWSPKYVKGCLDEYKIHYPGIHPWIYKASDETAYPHAYAAHGWKPSIHMPKEASRIWQQVTNIKVERIADISEEDCIKEGVQSIDWTTGGKRYKDYLTDSSGYGHPDHDFPTLTTAKESFRSLWQKINGKPKPTKDGYIIYPFDEAAAKEIPSHGGAGVGHVWKNKPLTIITNPLVWCIEFKILSTTGKP